MAFSRKEISHNYYLRHKERLLKEGRPKLKAYRSTPEFKERENARLRLKRKTSVAFRKHRSKLEKNLREKYKQSPEWQAKNRERTQRYIQKARLRPEFLFKRYQNNAKNRSISFEITFEQFCAFWGRPCRYCGSLIETIGLDRMDNSRGYSLGNLFPCCYRCNQWTRAIPLGDFVQHAKKIAHYFSAPR
jgi:hypothetical protein